MKISFQNYESLLTDGGYSGTKTVSQATGLLCLSLLSSVLVQTTFYNDDLTPLTDSQIDQLMEDIAIASDEIMRNVSVSMFPIGFILASANHPSEVGAEWLPCDGGIYLRSLYPELYDVLDTAFIIDADEFITPELNEKFILGADDDIGDTGGSVDHILTAAQLPPHAHSVSSGLTPIMITLIQGIPPLQAGRITGDTSGAYLTYITDTGVVGSGNPHNNMPPYIRLRYWIRCQ